MDEMKKYRDGVEKRRRKNGRRKDATSWRGPIDREVVALVLAIVWIGGVLIYVCRG